MREESALERVRRACGTLSRPVHSSGGPGAAQWADEHLWPIAPHRTHRALLLKGSPRHSLPGLILRPEAVHARTSWLTIFPSTYCRSSRVPSGRVRSHVPCITPSTHSPSALPPSSSSTTPLPCHFPEASHCPIHVGILPRCTERNGSDQSLNEGNVLV